LQELVDRARGKKERRAANKLLKETDTPGRNTPASDVGVGRKGKKGKGKMTANDYDTPGVAGKRKRGMKSMSVTPSVIDDDDEERDMVS
jgi:ATP-dependent helicase STH1/SNF2